jgi:Mycoplasma protein of unknown function, DUF285
LLIRLFLIASNSNWNVSLVMDATMMFAYASTFNKSLCAWGNKLSNLTALTSMFLKTSCPLPEIATWFSYSPPGPFCHDCCCRPTLPSAIEGPIEVPLVPAAAGNMFSNLIVGWSARSRYRYGGSGGGTFTTLFDPTTQASTLRKVDGTFNGIFRSLWSLSTRFLTHAVFLCRTETVRGALCN